MKVRTYNLLSRIPFVDFIVQYVICDPTMRCSPFLADELSKNIIDYKKSHPDIVITRKVLKEINRK